MLIERRRWRVLFLKNALDTPCVRELELVPTYISCFFLLVCSAIILRICFLFIILAIALLLWIPSATTLSHTGWLIHLHSHLHRGMIKLAPTG